MGKRELLLVAVFVLLGAAVYQITAPARAPGTEGATLSAIWQNLRRHIKGNQATVDADVAASTPGASARELRITIPRAKTITVTGENRSDIAAALHVTARGFDDAEARAVAAATTVKLDRAGDEIVVHVDVARNLPRGAPAPQFSLALNVPRQLAVRVDPNIGMLGIAGVAAVDVTGTRGELHVSSIAGNASISHSGPQLTIDGCGDLKLTNRGGPVAIRKIEGTASIQMTGGRLDIEDLRGETRIDARSARIDVTLAAATPVAIYSTSGDISVTPTAAGYALDAAARSGRVAVADANIQSSGSTEEQRADGTVRGGGPQLMLRTTHANIEVRAHTK